ncbi:MAG: penicillin acylase family protein [Ferruginibacter sp.]|nr:penicillin acylase family protein [Cytophagales bacterium]
MKKTLLLLLLPLHLFGQAFTDEEINRWEKRSKRVTIIRDTWGIPHIYGQTDADAVFGLLYAQCEDDFNRVEMNYVEKLGRTAEVEGEAQLYNDLLIRLVIDSTDAVADYRKSPVWLKKLLDAHADAVNYYLHRHPEVKPALLRRFKPWYPLLWTDGSIGAISTAGVTVDELKAFYTGTEATGAIRRTEEVPTGSNGFAFSPSVTQSGKAILYINPHVTFYFRPEVHMVSEEGLNAYGAVTWGQFFVYQGFNEHCGWMHTSSAADISDAYVEKVSQRNQSDGPPQRSAAQRNAAQWFYAYDQAQKPVSQKKITLRYRREGTLAAKTIRAFYTHHGPVMAKRNGQWLSVKANNRSLDGLIQSWQRTKANSFPAYQKVMDRLANTSNNTVYADAEGNIAYWHGNFLPVRDTAYDWSEPVDGSTSATEWKGLHPVAQSVHLYNPPNGWLQNCNSTPFTAAGSGSPRRENYPKYLAPDGENFRGVNAVRVLGRQTGYTLEKVIAAGYDTYLAAFEVLVPALVKAFGKDNRSDSLRARLAEPVALLSNWDYRSGEASVATTLAIEWGQRLLPAIQRTKVAAGKEADLVEKTKQFVAGAAADELTQPLREVIGDLENKFGRWPVAWGEINRFQRVSGDVNQPYNDDKMSRPVGFASSTWGMLPSYTSRYFPGTKKRYGVNGNSFVCAVEFGEKIRAKSLLAGGESGNPDSKHFADQAEMYTKGQFKEVLFYREDVQKHAERTYHPGE